MATKKSAKKAAKKGARVARPKSVSGKYKSIYHLHEVLFSKNKDADFDTVFAVVKKEFPKSAYAKNHFSWYKSHIVSHGEFRFEPMPKWSKGPKAAVKTTKKATKKVEKKVSKKAAKPSDEEQMDIGETTE